MKGNYIGKKPSGYSAVSANETGVWEIYDQGQMVRDTQWTGQPWEVNNGYYLNKKWTVGLSETAPADVQFNDDGTQFYVVGANADRVYQYSCTTAWDVTTSSYTGKSFFVETQEANSSALFFKSDGTKFYILGLSNNTVYQYSCATAWDVSTAFYENKAFSIRNQEGTSRGIFFKPDGTKFYAVGSANNRIYQYSCTTAWDVSTASYENKSFSVSIQDGGTQGLFFKPDGAKFYVVGQENDTVYQYSCATAWDVSTGSYDTKVCRLSGIEGGGSGIYFKPDGTRLYVIGTTLSLAIEFTLSTAWDVSTNNGAGGVFYVGGQDSNPYDVHFKTDGTKFYIIGTANDTVYQYSCATAWDVSTGSYDSKSFSIAAQETTPAGLFFKPDGLKFYIIGTTNDTVYQYSCGTAWDVSTASYDTKSFSIAAQETVSTAIFFKPDGLKFYAIGQTNDTVYQYSCATAWDVSTASYDTKSFSINTQEVQPTGLFFKSDGTKFYVLGNGSDTVFQYTCSTAWDVSTASYDSKLFSIATQDPTPEGLFFKSDGTRLYVIGSFTDNIYQYDLPLAWDVVNAGFGIKSFAVNLQDSAPSELTFSSDGTKLYLVGITGFDAVYQYTCSTAWDINTAVFNYNSSGAYGRARVNTQETNPTGLSFKSDGTKFYIVGSVSDTVYQYSCATAWDVSTASYDSKSFSVNTQETNPQALFFKPDGAAFYIIGSINDTVYQYTCATAWDVSTASYASKSFGVVQDSTPLGLFFKSDGTKFYIVGSGNDTVYQYSCATAWDVSTASYDSRSLNIGLQEGSPTGLVIDESGRFLYICGSTSPQGAYQYSLV
jgi:sugar lactone lactonase YvrE